MLTLLAPLIGLLGSLLPSIVKLFERKQEIEYELAVTQLKIEAAKTQAEIAFTTTVVQADRDEGKSVRDHDASLDGGKYIETLRASVRPILTYLFFALFVVVKIVAMVVMIQSGLSTIEILKAVWDVETMSLFSTIMAFWFGARFFDKVGNRPLPGLSVTTRK